MNSTERVIEMLEHRGIREPLILDAVHAINREFFLEGVDRDPSPEVLGRMLQAMKLEEGGRLLQIGTGSGYAAAILSIITSVCVAMDSFRIMSLVLPMPRCSTWCTK